MYGLGCPCTPNQDVHSKTLARGHQCRTSDACCPEPSNGENQRTAAAYQMAPGCIPKGMTKRTRRNHRPEHARAFHVEYPQEASPLPSLVLESLQLFKVERIFEVLCCAHFLQNCPEGKMRARNQATCPQCTMHKIQMTSCGHAGREGSLLILICIKFCQALDSGICCCSHQLLRPQAGEAQSQFREVHIPIPVEQAQSVRAFIHHATVEHLVLRAAPCGRCIVRKLCPMGLVHDQRFHVWRFYVPHV